MNKLDFNEEAFLQWLEGQDEEHLFYGEEWSCLCPLSEYLYLETKNQGWVSVEDNRVCIDLDEFQHTPFTAAFIGLVDETAYEDERGNFRLSIQQAIECYHKAKEITNEHNND